MATAAAVLKVAASQLGVKEDPPYSNKTPYCDWYGMVGPWCAMFVSWCLDQVGITRWRHAYTPTGFGMFRNAGRLFFDHPEPGDLVYFDFPSDSIHRISHVGFVESVNPDGTLNTIEGNTNKAGSRTGGEVLRHRRDPIKHGVRGYGRPEYDYLPFPQEDDDMDPIEHQLLVDLHSWMSEQGKPMAMRVAAIQAQVNVLAAAQGVDPEALEEAVKQALREGTDG